MQDWFKNTITREESDVYQNVLTFAEWTDFSSTYQEGDIIWEFEVPQASHPFIDIRTGISLVRNSAIVKSYTTKKI
jgi:hypothetical protein